MIQVNRLSIEDARTLTGDARARAQEIGVPMCISITDESGNLISFERMNGGKVTSAMISQDKAYTAAATANDASMAAHLEAKELAARVSGLLFDLPAQEDDELPID